MNEVGQGEVLCQDGTLSPGLCLRPCMLRPVFREQANGGSTLLLQGSQGLSPTTGPYPHLRQDSPKTGHRYTRGDDCFGSNDQRGSLWRGRLWLRTWFIGWNRRLNIIRSAIFTFHVLGFRTHLSSRTILACWPHSYYNVLLHCT